MKWRKRLGVDAGRYDSPANPVVSCGADGEGPEVTLCVLSRDRRWVLVRDVDGTLELPSVRTTVTTRPSYAVQQLCAQAGLDAMSARPVGARAFNGTLSEIVYGLRARPFVCDPAFRWVPVRMLPWATDSRRVRAASALVA